MHQLAAIPGRSPARSAGEPPARWPVRQRVAVHPAGQRVAQLAALANGPRPGGPGVVQRWADLDRPVAAHHGAVPAASVFTPLPPTARKIFRRVGATSSPADPGDMARWKRRGLLGDPSKFDRQSLTRMHAIRGRFGGPAAANNMFLGTALSNNFSSRSHYKLVEAPLDDYVTGGQRGEIRAVDYSVTPNFNNIPGYMAARVAGIADPAERAAFRAYSNAHIPDGFTCNATLYSQIGAGVTSEALLPQPVSTTVGAPAGPAPVVAAPVAPAVLGPANALAVGHAVAAVQTGVAKTRAVASESGLTSAVTYGGLAATAGYIGASLLTGPVGWAAGLLGAAGAIYGYATAEND